jgi:hypothetical protein
VNAVRWAIRARARVWSGVFRLTGTSSMSEPWIGTIGQWYPLTAILQDEPRAPSEEVFKDARDH